MIQMNNSSNNKIKENKYKILRMSLLLGNGDDREETINNFEDAAREIDAMNDEVYLKDIDSKFYDTLTLEEEEKKLTALVDYIGGRVEQRESLLDDFSNVTGFELVNLPIIKYQDRLDDYKSRLGYIKEYLGNTEKINRLNLEISDFENKLNEAYVKKSKAEENNAKAEKELLNRFKIIISGISSFKDVTGENVSSKLSEVSILTDESKKSLDIFNKSFATLDQVGISDNERDEYLSYVDGAKEAYYSNKENEYLLKIYVMLNEFESEYSKILFKRNSLNDLIYERINLRKELNIKDNDVLNGMYDLLDRQYDDIKSQSTNIENIDVYTREIDLRKSEVSSLEQDNQKVEILSLLREFCLIDTYDDTGKDSKGLNDDIMPSVIDIPVDDTLKTDEEVDDENSTLTVDDSFSFKDEEIKKEDLNQASDSSEDEVSDYSNESNDINSFNEVVDVESAKDNQVISVEDAVNMDVASASAKSNSVMRRVGEMLGVKLDAVSEKVVNTEENIGPSQDAASEKVDTVIESDNNKNDVNIDYSVDNVIPNDIFNNNFDADPETNSQNDVSSEPALGENPLFNNDLANTTIDEVMAKNKEDNVNEVNDFWDTNDASELDLNSLPDLNVSTDVAYKDNNSMPSLDFPDLDASGLNEEEGK